MAYRVVVMPKAEKELGRLSKDAAHRIVEHLEALSANPRPSGIAALRGSVLDGFRLRVGDYRALYTVDDAKKVVTIYSVGHRKDVYRKHY